MEVDIAPLPALASPDARLLRGRYLAARLRHPRVADHRVVRAKHTDVR